LAVIEREVRELGVVLRVADREWEAPQEAIMRSLCPDPDHDGFCEVPWFIYCAAWSDLDEDERRLWADDIDRWPAVDSSELHEIRIVMQGTLEQLDTKRRAILQALQPESAQRPWVVYGARYASIPEDQRQGWADDFDADRRRAGVE